jgi:hypothetical protein
MAPSNIGSNPQSDEYNNGRDDLIRRPIVCGVAQRSSLAFAKAKDCRLAMYPS